MIFLVELAFIVWGSVYVAKLEPPKSTTINSSLSQSYRTSIRCTPSCRFRKPQEVTYEF